MSKRRSKFIKNSYTRANYKIFFSLRAFSEAKLAQEKADNDLNEKWKIVKADPSVTQEQRELFFEISRVVGTCSKLIETAKEYHLAKIIEHSKYKLYKDSKSKRIVIICHFFKAIERKFKYKTLILKNGLPTNSLSKTKLFWNFKSIPPKGMKLVDQGKLSQKFIFFDKWIWTFSGHKKFFLYNFLNASDPNANWHWALTKERFKALKDKR